MSLIINLQIAKTHLLAKRRQTIIASLGVTFGISMFITMISIMTGVNGLLEETSLASTPHIRIFHDIESQRESISEQVFGPSSNLIVVHHPKPKNEQNNLKNGLLIARHISEQPNVFGVSPQLSTQAFYTLGPMQIAGILSGVDILAEDRLYNLGTKMRSGNMKSLQTTRNGIIMGIGLAAKLNVATGDNIRITAPNGTSLLMRVVGTFRYGIGTIDNTRSYVSLSSIQKLLNKNNRYITDIHIKLKDLTTSKVVAAQYQKQFGYKAEDWETANATIVTSFAIRNAMTAIVVLTLLIVAGFGIYNIMNMSVQNKLKDIAILKAVGFDTKDVIQIFLLQSGIIGVMGAVVGLIFGFFITYGISKIPFDGGEFLSIDTFPVNMAAKFYVIGFFFGIITTTCAGYFPSRRASKVDPVEILRG